MLALEDGQDGASVWFLDGAIACGPMDIPQVLVDMMKRLYETKHIGSGL